MAIGRELGLNFVYLLFLLLPGFVAVKAYLRANRRLDDLSRLDKVAASIAGGLGSLALLLVLYRMGPPLLAWALHQPWPAMDNLPRFRVWFRQADGVRITAINRLPVLAAITAIAVQAALAAVIGSLLGVLVSTFGRAPKQSRADLEQPWESAFQSSKRGDRVTVLTRDGMEVRGVVHRIGSPSENYDLLLRRSREIVRIGNAVVDERPLANVTYHHHDDISQIHLHDSPGIEEFSPPGRLALFSRELTIKLEAVRERIGMRWHPIGPTIADRLDRSTADSDDADEPEVETEQPESGQRES